MANIIGGTNIAKASFRESFKFPVYFMPDVFTKVFPIHMAKGVNSMRAKAMKCDCLIEIRDARVPISSYNHRFEHHMRSHHNRLLLINKIDLANERATKDLVENHIDSTNTKVLYTNNKPGTRENSQSIKRVMSVLKHMASEKKEDALKDKGEMNEGDDGDNDEEDVIAVNKTFRTMIYGLPNAGKSSFINSTRQKYTKGRGKKPTKVGKNPGVTTSVLSNIILCDSPKMMILDTPGIVPPNLKDPLVGMRLALIGTFPDRNIGEEMIADFLLYTLNKQDNRSYLDMCGLKEPCDDFEQVIASHSTKHGLMRAGAPDYRQSSVMLIEAYRNGKFGKMTLD